MGTIRGLRIIFVRMLYSKSLWKQAKQRYLAIFGVIAEAKGAKKIQILYASSIFNVSGMVLANKSIQIAKRLGKAPGEVGTA